MKTGFDDTNVMTIWRGQDRPDLLPSGFYWWWNDVMYRHKPGGYTDGLSSPQFIRLDKDADARGWAFPAAVAHDGGYHADLEVLVDGVWKAIDLSRSQCDQMFKDLLQSIADTTAKQLEAQVFYEAVNLYGGPAYTQGHTKLT